MFARSWSSVHLASLTLLTLALLPKSIKIYCINTFTFPEQRFLTITTASKSISKLEIDGQMLTDLNMLESGGAAWEE